jgi:hypothetical protein
LYEFLVSPMPAICSAHTTFTDLFLIIFSGGTRYAVLSSLLLLSLRFILLSTMFSNTQNVRVSLSHPYKTPEIIIFLRLNQISRRKAGRHNILY